MNEIQLVGSNGEVTDNLTINNIGNNFTVDVLNAFAGGGDNLTLNSTTPGSTFTTTLDIGMPVAAPSNGTHSFLGLVSINGFGTVDLNSNGDGTFHNTINGLLVDNTPGGGVLLNIGGTDALNINQNSATPLFQSEALGLLGNGTFVVDTDKGTVFVNGNTDAGSIDAHASGGWKDAVRVGIRIVGKCDRSPYVFRICVTDLDYDLHRSATA